VEDPGPDPAGRVPGQVERRQGHQAQGDRDGERQAGGALAEVDVVAGQDLGGKALPGDLGFGGRLGVGAVAVRQGGHDQEGGGEQQL
jgi:hypothetical protein